MYLTDILIENVGPIQKVDLRLPFTDAGLPKPVILVGANGAGKTIVQATIATLCRPTAWDMSISR